MWCHLATDSKASNEYESATLQKWEFAYFSPKCRAIIPLSKEYFRVSYVAPFGYKLSANEGTPNFSQNLWKFPHLPKNRG